MNLRVPHIAEERVVTPHVVIINRLLQERSRAFEQKLFGLGGFSQFVQTETGVQKSGAAFRRDPAELATDEQCARPFFLVHEMVQPELQYFRPVLERGIDRVQLAARLTRHAQFGIATRSAQVPVKIHGCFCLSRKLAASGSEGWNCDPERFRDRYESKSPASSSRRRPNNF